MDDSIRRDNDARMSAPGRAVDDPSRRGGVTKIFVFFVWLVCKDHLQPPLGGDL
jgi:hypothetical protein